MFLYPQPTQFFCVCVCFMAMLLKPRRFIFPLVGLILGVWQRCVRTRIEWLGWLRIADPLHPVPVSLVDLKILCGVITGLKWGKTHIRSVGLGLLLCRNYARPESASALFLCNVTGGHLLQGGPPLLLYSGSNLTTVDAWFTHRVSSLNSQSAHSLAWASCFRVCRGRCDLITGHIGMPRQGYRSQGVLLSLTVIVMRIQAVK